MKVQPEKYGTRRPKLTVDDLDGDAGVVTIATVEEVTIDDEEGKRVSLVLTFEETGDKAHWLNQSQIDYLVDKLGDESEDWQGKVIPLERHDSTFRGKKFEKLWVAAPERWAEIFKAAGITSAPKRAKVGKVGKVAAKAGKVGKAKAKR